MTDILQKALAAGLDEATLKKMLALLPAPAANPKAGRKQRPDNVARRQLRARKEEKSGNPKVPANKLCKRDRKKET